MSKGWTICFELLHIFQNIYKKTLNSSKPISEVKFLFFTSSFNALVGSLKMCQYVKIDVL